MRVPLPEHYAKHPSIPTLLWCGLVLWLGCYVSSVITDYIDLYVFLTCCVIVLVVILITLFVRLRKNVSIFLCVISIFFIFGSLLWTNQVLALDFQRTELLKVSGTSCLFRITEDPTQGFYGSSVVAEVSHHSKEIGLVTLYLPHSQFKYGDEFSAQANYSLPADSQIMNYNTEGILATATIESYELSKASLIGSVIQIRNTFTQRIDQQKHTSTATSEENINTEAIALLKGLVLGDRTELFELSLYREVKILGLAHLVAVSGSHLVIVMGFVSLVLKGLRVSKAIAIGIQISLLGIYVCMVGFPISCIRAALMTGVSILSFTMSRRSHALSGLGIVIVILMVISPSTAFSLSFALSALSTLGIVLFMPLISSWMRVKNRFVQTFLIDPIAMTLASLVLTFPLSIASFSMFSIIAPLANCVASLLVSIICIVGLIAFVALPLEPLCLVLLTFAIGVTQVFCMFIHALSWVPFAAVPMDSSLPLLVALSMGFGCALWILWPLKITRKLIAGIVSLFCLFVAISFAPWYGTSITMIDVGQGDAFLVKSNNQTLLIDTGYQSKKLYSGLARSGITHLDAILITHADSDHCGALRDLKGIVRCDRVILAEGMQNVNDDNARELIDDAIYLVGASNVTYIKAKDTISLDTVSFTVLSPENLNDAGGNQDSICCLLRIDSNQDSIVDWTGLFCGDAEAQTLEPLVNKYQIEHIDILKVSHHGAKASLTDSLIEKLRPKIALISVGQDNRYGHPSEETIDRLEAVESTILRSDTNGDVVCSFTSDQINIHSLR